MHKRLFAMVITFRCFERLEAFFYKEHLVDKKNEIIVGIIPLHIRSQTPDKKCLETKFEE